MIISHKYKFIFVKTAKTAGTSIEVFLDQYCGENDILTPFAFPEEGHRPRNYKGKINTLQEVYSSLGSNRKSPKELKDLLVNTIMQRRFYHHIPAWKIKGRVPDRVWDTYLKFAVERNPWDKVISGWLYQNRRYGKNLSLNQYIDFCENRINKNVRGSGRCPYNFPNYTDPKAEEVMIDRILKYENLDNEFREILNDIGIDSVRWGSVFAKSSGRKKDYREFYNLEQRKRVGELFKKEIELHGYTFK